MQSFRGLNFLGGLTTCAVDTAQTFTSQLSRKSAANRIMNSTRVSAWERGEANPDLLHSSSSKEWGIMPCMGTSVQAHTATPVETSCPAPVLPFVTRGCHQLALWPTALQDAEFWGHLLRWQLFFHRWNGMGEEKKALWLPWWNQKILAGVRPSGEYGTEASRCVCLILKHTGRSVHECELLPVQPIWAVSAQNTPLLLWHILFPPAENSGCGHSSEKYKSRACTAWQNRAFYRNEKWNEFVGAGKWDLSSGKKSACWIVPLL